MNLKKELEKMSGVRNELELYGMPVGPSYAESLTSIPFRVQRPEERAAETFMEGLRSHAENLARGLKENQELQMYCYQGPEKLRVLEIAMPSENVVALRCINERKEETHVTGHMHSVNFSFVIHTIVPPEIKLPLGFRMPSGE